MRILDEAIFIEANSANFSPTVRHSSAIKYIVVHYTGNINDTARNNALYFRDAPIQSSAHFFVSDDTVYQSVRLNHAAYAVGLGARKEPYFKWPTMWKKITNTNSVSVEICGSKNSREGTEQTKQTAAKLIADLLDKYNLTPSCVYRHFDVTGKECPAWAVGPSTAWLQFRMMICDEFYGKGDDSMLNNEENYNLFKVFIARYIKEQGEQSATWEKEAMQFCEDRKIMTGGRPKSYITRGELATVIKRIEE